MRIPPANSGYNPDTYYNVTDLNKVAEELENPPAETPITNPESTSITTLDALLSVHPNLKIYYDEALIESNESPAASSSSSS